MGIVTSILPETQRASEAVKKYRYAICSTKCPFFKPKTKSCGTLLFGGTKFVNGKKIELCGCYMPDATGVKQKKCPAEKW